MLTVFVFDEQESRRKEDLAEACKGLDDDAMVWIALRDPTEQEVATVQKVLGLVDEQAKRLLEPPSQASIVESGEHMHVTLYVASSDKGAPVLRPLRMCARTNWVVTAHEEIEVLEDFRKHAEGGSQVGSLDSPSFVAAAVEWVITASRRGVARAATARGRGRAPLPRGKAHPASVFASSPATWWPDSFPRS